MKGTGSKGYNLCMANSSTAGQTVHHCHFHIIPRFTEDNAKKANFQWTQEDTLKYEDKEIENYRTKITQNL